MFDHNFRGTPRQIPPGVRVEGRSVQYGTPTAIDLLIAQQIAAGEGFRADLFRAASAGKLNLAVPVRGALVRSRILKLRSPTVVLLPDDHPSAIGPEAWPQARKLARWASLVALHATAGQSAHYQMFAEHAVRHGRLLIVEVELRHLPAWLALVQQERQPSQILCLIPRPGGQHPVSPTQAGMVLQ